MPVIYLVHWVIDFTHPCHPTRALKVCYLGSGTTVERLEQYCAQECSVLTSARSSIPRRCNPIESMLQPSVSTTDTSWFIPRALTQMD